MTKSELIEILASKQAHLKTKDVELAVHSIVNQLAESISNGKRIEIRGFGSFSLRRRQARRARNPKTGEAVTLNVRYMIHFRSGGELRDKVDAGKNRYRIVD